MDEFATKALACAVGHHASHTADTKVLNVSYTHTPGKHEQVSHVYRIKGSWTGADQQPVTCSAFLKRFSSRRKFEQAHRFYSQIAPLLQPHSSAGSPDSKRNDGQVVDEELHHNCPTLLAVDVAQHMLAFSDCGSHGAQTPDSSSHNVQRCAGRWLRALHSVPWKDDDSMPVHTALPKRWMSWAKAGRKACVDTVLTKEGLAPLSRLQARFLGGDADADISAMNQGSSKRAKHAVGHEAKTADVQFPKMTWKELLHGCSFSPQAGGDGGTRLMCHRDFTSSNWIVTPSTTSAPGTLYVIDFEHSVADIWLWDLVKLQYSPGSEWHSSASAREAFLSPGGYNHSLSSHEQEVLRRLGILHGLSTLVWALQQQQGGQEHSGMLEEGVGVLKAVWKEIQGSESTT